MWFGYMLGVLDITVDCVPRLLPLDGEITVYKDTALPQKARCVVGLQRGQSQEEGERISRAAQWLTESPRPLCGSGDGSVWSSSKSKAL